MMATTDLTAAEQAGIAQFRASMATATEAQKASGLGRLRDGSVARMPGAPRQEVIDAMIAIMVGEEQAEVPAPAAPQDTPAAPPVGTDLAIGTRAVVVITETGKGFGKAVEYIKRLGGKFDAQGKVWVVRITEGNASAARHLVSENGAFTGYRLIDKAAWVARRQNGGR